MFLKKNIIQHQQNIEKLIIDYKLLKKAMNFLYKKRIIKAGGINMEWWKKSVVYQIYVKSFQDSNNDGVGDLQGIISRLDYLKTLGVDVLWLTPIFKSPNDDNGYDISDYRSIQSEFGTMSDFEELLDKAHQKDIKIILDLVFNHTSDEHFWFQESKKSKNNPYRDYYIWKEGNEGDVPNNWTSCFQGSAWELDEKTNEYYLHLFSKKQPDLNWQNPKVRQECIDIMNYWVDKGVDGFRLDVINLISKDESQYYVDSTIKGHQVCANGPHIHEYIQEMNQKVFSRKELLTVGETPAVTIEDAKKYAPLDNKELSMVFQFELMNVDGAEVNKWTDQRFSLKDLKQLFNVSSPDVIPFSLPMKFVILAIGILLCTLGCSLYITSDLGTGCYDALSIYMADVMSPSYPVCRIMTDVVCVLIGFITGGPLGIATIILMFGTGPLISTWNKLVSKPIVEKFA